MKYKVYCKNHSTKPTKEIARFERCADAVAFMKAVYAQHRTNMDGYRYASYALYCGSKLYAILSYKTDGNLYWNSKSGIEFNKIVEE